MLVKNWINLHSFNPDTHFTVIKMRDKNYADLVQYNVTVAILFAAYGHYKIDTKHKIYIEPYTITIHIK